MVRRTAKIKSKAVATAAKHLPIGASLVCTDNTGARIVQLISVAEYHGRRRRLAHAGIGDMINCRVLSGGEKVRNEVFQAIVVRQRKEYRRRDGTRVKFEDNAAVLTTPDGDLKGTEIKGPVGREAVNKWPSIGSAASIVI